MSSPTAVSLGVVSDRGSLDVFSTCFTALHVRLEGWGDIRYDCEQPDHARRFAEVAPR